MKGKNQVEKKVDVQEEEEDFPDLRDFEMILGEGKPVPVKFENPELELYVHTVRYQEGNQTLTLFIQVTQDGKVEKQKLCQIKKKDSQEQQLELLLDASLKPHFYLEGKGKIQIIGQFAPKGFFPSDSEEEEIFE